MPVICFLYNTLKNSKFPVWNDFQFWLTARQKECKNFLIPLCACVVGTNSEAMHVKMDNAMHKPLFLFLF